VPRGAEAAANELHHTERQRCVAFLKLHVSFRNRVINHRALLRNVILRKMTKARTGWRRRIGCCISVCHFQQKSPVGSGFFAERDLQVKAFCVTHAAAKDLRDTGGATPT